MHVQRARLAAEAKDYARLNIIKDQFEPHEDGMRTHGKEGTYEWWYTDAEFEDGTTIVTIFYTKNYFDVPGKAWPTVDITITYPDGTRINECFQEPKGSMLNASKTVCEVNIGDSYLRYRDGKYVLHYQAGEIVYHAVMTSQLPMWRPSTGHWLYGNEEDHFFAWFVAQPSALVEATLTLRDQSTSLTGSGYHDHNWGNIAMDKLMNHWYWGRAKVGPFDIIACDIIAEKKYNYQRLPVFMLARNGKVITDNQALTQVQRLDTFAHPVTGKFMDNQLIYRQQLSPHESYTISFIRDRDIIAMSLLDTLTPLKARVGRLLGANPTYARVLGEVRITHEKNGQQEVYANEGLWEQMFFGKNKHAMINES